MALTAGPVGRATRCPLLTAVADSSTKCVTITHPAIAVTIDGDDTVTARTITIRHPRTGRGDLFPRPVRGCPSTDTTVATRARPCLPGPRPARPLPADGGSRVP